MLKITAYAQRLLDDLDDVDYIERVKIQQRNWIGRSTGAEVDLQDQRSATKSPFTPPVPTPCSARPIWSSRPSTRCSSSGSRISPTGATLRPIRPQAARKSDFERTRAEQGQDRRPARRRRGHKPRNAQEDPDLHLRLCPHGATAPVSIMARSGPRPARLGVCQQVRPADHRGRLRRRRDQGSLRTQRTTPPSWSIPVSSTA